MAEEKVLTPPRPSLVEFVKEHPVVALAAYTLFVVGAVFASVKSMGVKHIDYFGVEAEIEAGKKEVFEQREKTIEAQLATVTAKKDCQAVEISALQARNEVTNLQQSLAKCQSSATPVHTSTPPVHTAPSVATGTRTVAPEQWRHEAMPAATGSAVAERLSELGRAPEDLAVFYDRHDNVFHLWYAGRDRRKRYEYRVALPSDLGERPQVNFFKQDPTIVPAGIGGSSPVPIYFRVTQ